MFIRIIESKTNNKISVETLIDILKDYNFQHFEGNGYVPTYARNEMTDLLHESFDFRTDYQIVSEKNMKKIIKKTKKQKILLHFRDIKTFKNTAILEVFYSFNCQRQDFIYSITIPYDDQRLNLEKPFAFFSMSYTFHTMTSTNTKLFLMAK